MNLALKTKILESGKPQIGLALGCRDSGTLLV